MNSKILSRFRSCYIVAVDIANDYIRLEDSGRGEYFIDKKDIQCIEQFKKWFSSIFSTGEQHLTVLNYSNEEKGTEQYSVVKKFVNIQ